MWQPISWQWRPHYEVSHYFLNAHVCCLCCGVSGRKLWKHAMKVQAVAIVFRYRWFCLRERWLSSTHMYKNSFHSQYNVVPLSLEMHCTHSLIFFISREAQSMKVSTHTAVNTVIYIKSLYKKGMFLWMKNQRDYVKGNPYG